MPLFYLLYGVAVSIGSICFLFFSWALAKEYAGISVEPQFSIVWMGLAAGVAATLDKWRENIGVSRPTSFLNDVIVTTLLYFLIWYGSWALLWIYKKVLSPPTPGWWDGLIIAAALLQLLESVSDDFEKREGRSGRSAFGGAYKRAAALGAIFGLWLFAVFIEWFQPPAIFRAEWIAAGALSAISGSAASVFICAGRGRVQPFAIICDFSVGAITGLLIGGAAVGLWGALTNELPVKQDLYTLLSISVVLGAGTNVWRKQKAPSFGSLIRGAAEAASRGKTLIIGLWFAAIGSVLLWVFEPSLVKAASDRSAAPIELIWPAAWTAIGGYLFFARGLGPMWNALSWSRSSGDTHGRARTATLDELRQAGLIPRGGNIYLGRFLKGSRAIHEAGYPGRVHLITIGPNGSGKGMGLILPNLVDQKRSILITDPKGEAAAMTARLRSKMGRVVVLNPFNLFVEERPYMKSHGFNPLSVLKPGSQEFVDDAMGFGEALVRVEGNEPHWPQSAQDLVAALIMHECLTRGPDASLTNVRKLLTEPFMMMGDEPIGLAKTIQEMTESKYLPLRSKASRFLSLSKEMHGIISSAVTQTRFIDSPPIAGDLARGTFDFADMKREIVTVYLILPAGRLTGQSNWLRLMVQSALTALQTAPSATLPPPILLLDEFAQLGYLPSIENAMGMLRGYGVQLWPILQDLNQLKTLYKDRWQSFIGNRGVLTAFAPRDLFTAEHLSKLCGQKTEIVETENEREGQANRGRSWGPQGMPLFRPEDLMKMPKGQMLCIVDGVDNPFFTHVPGYWDTNYNRGIDSNPYYTG